MNSPLLYTPPTGWVNDPNGLVYVDGTYHLFYQYNPYSNTWGNISWGHAVSTDLVHWENKGVGLHYKVDSKEFLFSGSAVYDTTNTSGFGSAKNSPLVAMYTSHYSENTTLPNGTKVEEGTQSQSIAYSIDKGNTWNFYSGNPVIRSPPVKYASEYKNFRDPKVFWYAPESKWIMINVLSQNKIALFWSSQNLKDWSLMSEFNSIYTPNEIWECPDIFELKVPNGKSKWVLLISTNPGGVAKGSGMHYYIGDFDGNKFTEEKDTNYNHIKWLDYGSDFYAGVTWNNVNTGRYIIGWIDNWDYALLTSNEYKGALGFARELSLISVNETIKISQRPVLSLINYRKDEQHYTLGAVQTGVDILRQKTYELIVEMYDIGAAFSFILEDDKNNAEAAIEYNNRLKSLSIRKKSRYVDESSIHVVHDAPYSASNRETFRIFIDGSTLTLFTTNGDVVFTELMISYAEKRKFYLAQESQVKLNVTRYLLEF